MHLTSVSRLFIIMNAKKTNSLTGTRSRLYNSTGFFFLLWAAHYIPFYIMGRQLFLHHYLPAHLASALVSGALIEFIFNVEPGATSTSANVIEALNSPSDSSFGKKAAPKPATKQQLQERRRPIRERIGGQSLLMTWAAAGVVIAVIFYGYIFFAPLTYGRPGLDVDQILARKWLGYDLHFAK